jgi:serine protease
MHLLKSLRLILVATLVLGALPLLGQDDGRYMIQFKDFRGAANSVRAAGGTPIYEFEDLRTVAAHLPSQAIRGLQNNPNVVLIEVDPRRELMAQTIPYGIPMVEADQVPFNSANAAGSKVCIIDSGYYIDHEDLQNANVTWDTDSGTGNPLVDGCGHGTHVAGTIAALNNTLGVLGVVGDGTLPLHIIKVFANDCAWRYSSDLINALNKCRSAGAKVVNMSLGGSFSSNAEQTAFQNAYNAGVLSIAAAGNAGNTRRSYPASYSSVVSVAAVDSNKNHASFSQRNSDVELAAPGVSVLSTVPWQGAHITVDGVRYLGAAIEFSASSNGVSGGLVSGGRCTSTGSWSGKVVLCERGDISFYDKTRNVQLSGGVAAVIYNNEPGGFAGTLGSGNSSTIPAISLSQEDGQYLVASKLNASGTVVSSTAAGSGYEAWDGTSMATPHVAGVAALIWSHVPNKSNAEIRQALQATAEDLGAAGKDNSFGYGLIRACAALQYLGGSCDGSGGGGDPDPDPPNQAPTASFTVSTTDLTANFTDTSTDSDGTIVSWSWNFGDGSTSTAQHPTRTYAAAGTYTVSLTVTDNDGATGSTSQSVSVTSGSTGDDDTTPPVISNVSSANTKGNKFVISWSTDEPATSEVVFTCCGEYTSGALVTSHSMEFNGRKGQLYEYFVSSTDAAGNKATAGPFFHQN